MVLIVELHPAVKPIEPAASLIIYIDFDASLRETQVLVIVYLDHWLVEVVPP